MPKPSNMDIQLGWDLEQVGRIFEMVQTPEATAEKIPTVSFDQPDLTVQKVHQLEKTLRTLERNDDTEGIALLKVQAWPNVLR